MFRKRNILYLLIGSIPIYILLFVFIGCSGGSEAQYPNEPSAVADQSPPPNYNQSFFTKFEKVPDNLVYKTKPSLFISRVEIEKNKVRLFLHLIDKNGVFYTGAADPKFKKNWCSVITNLKGNDKNIEDFKISEITEETNSPDNISFLIDESGSMGAERATILQEAMCRLINSKKEPDAFSVIKFDNNVKVEAPLTEDAYLLKSQVAVNGLEGFGGGTALLDAVKTGIQQVTNTKRDKAAKSIFLFTDGMENASNATDSYVITNAINSNTSVNAIGFGYGVNDSYLKNLTNSTGGMYNHIYSSGEIDSVLNDVYRKLKNYYILEYNTDECGTFSVKVKLCLPNDSLVSNSNYKIVCQTVTPKIADCKDQTVEIFKNVSEWDGHPGPVKSLSYNKSGTLLASGGDDATIKIWNVSTGALVKTLLGHTDKVTSVSFSPNEENKLISGSQDKTVKLWDISAGKNSMTLSDHTLSVNCVKFSSDGFLIASASDDNTIKIWHTENGKLLKTLIGHNNYITSFDFTPDDKFIISGSKDNTIRIWNVQSGVCEKVIKPNRGKIRAIATTNNIQNTKFAYSASDSSIVFIDLLTNNIIFPILKGHNKLINTLAFSPNDREIISGSDDETVIRWSVISGLPVQVIKNRHVSAVNSVVYSNDNNQFSSAGEDSKIFVWNGNNGNPLKDLTLSQFHTSKIKSISYNKNNTKAVTSADDGSVKIWNVDNQNPTLINTLIGNLSSVNSVSFSPRQDLIITGSNDNVVRLFNSNTGVLIKTYKDLHNDNVLCTKFASDGERFASSDLRGNIAISKIPNLRISEKPIQLVGHLAGVNSVAFSDDGNLLASGSFDRSIKIWNSYTGELIRTLKGHSDGVTSVVFNSTGDTLFSGSYDNTIKIWDLYTGRLINTIDLTKNGHLDIITSLDYNKKCNLLISTSRDGTIKVWDMNNYTFVTQVNFENGYPTCVSFSGDYNKILVGGYGNKNLKEYNLKNKN